MSSQAAAIVQGGCRAALCVLGALSFWTGRADAGERYALLIGASEYPGLRLLQPLPGPRNDVLLYRRVLEARGFEPDNVTVLADRVAGPQAPTRSAILQAFADLTKKVDRGDVVVVLLSGIGSRQPAASPAGDCGSALEQTFLASDAGPWDDKARTVQNVISGQELSSRVAALRERGAFVVAVLSFGHSEPLPRGIEDADIRPRSVGWQQLGIPSAAMRQAVTQTREGCGVAAAGPGAPPSMIDERLAAGSAAGFLSLEAARDGENELEEPQPAGYRVAEPHGRLAFLAARLLAGGRSLTWRQAGALLLSEYQAANYNDTTPVIKGRNLDRYLLDESPLVAEPTWPLVAGPDGLHVPVGALHGVAEGAAFELTRADGTAAGASCRGLMAASMVGLFATTLVPSEAFLSRCPDLRTEGGAKSWRARLRDPDLPVILRVALPPAFDVEKVTGARLARDAIEHLRSHPEGLSVRWTATAERGDVRLLIESERLSFLPPGGARVASGPNATPWIGLKSIEVKALAEAIADRLRRTAAVMQLARQSSRLADAPAAADIRYGVTLYRAGAPPVSIDLLEVPALRDRDDLEVTVQNAYRSPIDLTVRAIDGDGRAEDILSKRRIPAGSLPQSLPRVHIQADKPAQERLVFIAEEAFLEPIGRDGARTATRDAPRIAMESVGTDSERMRSWTPPILGASAIHIFRYNTGLGQDKDSDALEAIPSRAARMH